MPFYDYHCNGCGKDVEVLQKMSDPQLTECPQCHQNTLKKVMTAAEFRLKGNGWYETDFKKDGQKHLYHSDKSSS